MLRVWAGLGYYARARNLHACAKTVVARHGGRFPAGEEELRALPGIGAYTAAAIAAIAFGRRAVAVDGNVERVIARLFAIEAAAGGEAAKSVAAPRRWCRSAAPAISRKPMMDLGATICTPKKPACALCPWTDACAARARGDARDVSTQAAEGGGKVAPWRVVRGDARRRPCARSHPARKGTCSAA